MLKFNLKILIKFNQPCLRGAILAKTQGIQMVLELFCPPKGLRFGLLVGAKSGPILAPFWSNFGPFVGARSGQPEPPIWHSLWAGLAGPRAEVRKFPQIHFN